jgi:hypothetical protein
MINLPFQLLRITPTDQYCGVPTVYTTAAPQSTASVEKNVGRLSAIRQE